MFYYCYYIILRVHVTATKVLIKYGKLVVVNVAARDALEVMTYNMADCMI